MMSLLTVDWGGQRHSSEATKQQHNTPRDTETNESAAFQCKMLIWLQLVRMLLLFKKKLNKTGSFFSSSSFSCYERTNNVKQIKSLKIEQIDEWVDIKGREVVDKYQVCSVAAPFWRVIWLCLCASLQNRKKKTQSASSFPTYREKRAAIENQLGRSKRWKCF